MKTTDQPVATIVDSFASEINTDSKTQRCFSLLSPKYFFLHQEDTL